MSMPIRSARSLVAAAFVVSLLLGARALADDPPGVADASARVHDAIAKSLLRVELRRAKAPESSAKSLGAKALPVIGDEAEVVPGVLIDSRGHAIACSKTAKHVADLRASALTALGRTVDAVVRGRDPETGLVALELASVPDGLVPAQVGGNPQDGAFLADASFLGNAVERASLISVDRDDGFDTLATCSLAAILGERAPCRLVLDGRGRLCAIETPEPRSIVPLGPPPIPGETTLTVGKAIPIDSVLALVRQLFEKGRPAPGWLGGALAAPPEVDRAEIEARGRPGARGARLAGITTDGPAAKAGLREGDTVLAFDERPVTSVAWLSRAFALAGEGAKVRLEVLHDGSVTRLEVVLVERPGPKPPTGA